MRFILFSIAIALIALAVQAGEMPAGAADRHAKLTAKLSPSVRSWISHEARQLRLSPTVNEAAVRRDVACRFQGQNLPAGDIDSLVLLVLFECAAQEEQDLRSAMDEMQATNRQKQQQREQQAAMKEAKEKLRQESAPAKSNTPVRVIALRPLPATTAVATNHTDSVGDISAAQQLRLQMTMDRRSKTIETLSNLLKKMSETQDSLIQNLK